MPRLSNIIFFDDWFSILHLVAGCVSAILGLELEMTLIYIVYQLLEKREPVERKKGDLVEYVIGMVVGKIVSIVMGF